MTLDTFQYEADVKTFQINSSVPVTPLLGVLGGHALEGPAVVGHQAHDHSIFKKGFLTKFHSSSCTKSPQPVLAQVDMLLKDQQ